jgi:hypothetical protein
MYPWEEHSFLRRRSGRAKNFGALPVPRTTRTFPLDLTCLAPGSNSAAGQTGQRRARARHKSGPAGLGKCLDRKKPLPSLVVDIACCFCCGPCGSPGLAGANYYMGPACHLRPWGGLAAPFVQEGRPTNFYTVARCPWPGTPIGQPTKNVPLLRILLFTASTCYQKVPFPLKCRRKTTRPVPTAAS